MRRLVVYRSAASASKFGCRRTAALVTISFSLTIGLHGFASAQSNRTVEELQRRAQSLLVAGQLAEAEDVLVRAEGLAPSDPVILTLEAKVKGQLDEYSDAEELLRRVIQMTPKSAEAHLNLAIVLADSGDLPDALAETLSSTELAPNLAIAHLNRARILDDLKRDSEASAEFAMATRLAPQNPDCYFYWSFAERAQGNLSKETELLDRVVDLEPSNVKALMMLADSLRDQGRSYEAVATLRKVLAIDPNSSQATYMLSMAIRTSNPEESNKLLSQFEQLKLRNSIVTQAKRVANEAYHAFTVQDWRKASRLYKEALEICGDCEIEAALHRDLGLSLCRDGEIEQCTGELRLALSLNPDDRDALKALQVISNRNTTE